MSQAQAMNIVQTDSVDITPHENILTKAGSSEYSFASALAEQVDNCIQAVRNNMNKEIHITVKRIKGKNSMVLTILDNGVGMSHADLKNYLTLGVSQSDRAQEALRTGAAISGEISRFGVGAKRAAFFLGPGLRVTTKQKGTHLVYESTLSLGTLKSGGWKADIIQRELGDADPMGLESFTLVTIDPLEKSLRSQRGEAVAASGPETVEHFLAEEQVLSKLSHYYHFFLHPESYPGSTSSQTFASAVYHIYVNGKALRECEENMQRRYEESGVNPKMFHIAMEINQPSVLLRQTIGTSLYDTRVSVRLRYFPYVDGAETLPIPMEHASKDGEEGEDLPMEMRRPGLDVYWQARLIPEAYIPSLDWMKRGKHQNNIDDRWLRRVHGEIFLNEAFAVTHNKMHLVMDDPNVRNLLHNPNRKHKADFQKWLRDCHDDYDKDLILCGDTYDVKDDITRYNQCDRGREIIKVDSPVKVVSGQGGRISYGKVNAIYHRGRKAARTPEVFCVVDFLHADQETFSMKKITISNDKELKKYEKEQDAKLPQSVQLVDRQQYGPSWSYVVTQERNLSFILGLVSSTGQFVDQKDWQYCRKKDPKMYVVDLAIFDAEDNNVFNHTMETGTNMALGSQSNKAKCALDFSKCWVIPNKITSYKARLLCRWSKFTSEFKFKVVSGPPKVLKVSSDFLKSEIPLGEPFPPFHISLCDKLKNQVDQKQYFSPEKFSIKVSHAMGNKFHFLSGPSGAPCPLTPSKEPPYRVKVSPDVVEILGLCLGGRIGNHGGPEECVLQFSHEAVDDVALKLKVRPGPPLNLDLDEAPFGREKEHTYANLSPIPSFTVRLKDKFDNPISSLQKESPVSLELFCQHFIKPTYVFKFDDNGEAKVEGVIVTTEGFKAGANFVDSDISAAVNFLLTFPSKTGRRVSSQYEADRLAFTIVPSKDPILLSIVVLGTSGVVQEATSGGHIKITTCVESQLPLLLQVMNKEGLALPPSRLSNSCELLCTWISDEFSSPVISEDDLGFLLPPIQVTERAGDFQCTVRFRMTEAVGQECLTQHQRVLPEISVLFLVKAVAGDPHHMAFTGDSSMTIVSCGEPFTVKLNIMDRYGNVLSVFPSVRPQLKLEIKDANANIKVLDADYGQATYYAILQCTVAGKIYGDGEFILKATSKVSDDLTCKACFQMTPGKIHRTLINGMITYPPLQVSNHSSLLGLQISVQDAYGNKCSRGIERGLLTIQPPDDLDVKILDACPPTFSRGTATIERLWVGLKSGGPMYGVYSIPLYLTTNSKRESRTHQLPSTDGTNPVALMIKVNPGKTPNRIDIYDFDPHNEAGATFPDFHVMITAEDGSSCTMVDSASVHITIDGVVYDCTATKADRFHFKSIPMPTQAGSHKCEAILKYQSPFLGLQTLSEVLDFEVIPSRPQEICIKIRTDDGGIVDTPIAANLGSFLQRTVAHSMTISAVDAHQNVCTNISDQVLFQISPADSQSQGTSHPTFEDDLLERYWKLFQGSFTLGPLVLRESSEVKGTYLLNVSCHGLEGQVRLVITDNASVWRMKQQLDQEMETICNRKSNLTQQIKNLQFALDSGQQTGQVLFTVIERLTSEAVQLGALGSQFTEQVLTSVGLQWNTRALSMASDEALDTLSRSIQTIASSMSQEVVRESNIRFGANVQKVLALQSQEKDQYGIIGVVGDMFKHTDKKMATVLAKASGVGLGTVVVRGDNSVHTVQSKFCSEGVGIDVWSLDQIARCQFPVKNDGKLDLPFRDVPVPGVVLNAQTSGFREFAANAIELASEHQHLRNTIVYSTYGHTMIFDNIHNAMKYRAALVKRGVSCPCIVIAGDFSMLTANGIVKFEARSDLLPSFGAPPTTDDVHRRLQRLAEVLLSIVKQRIQAATISSKNEQIEKDLQRLNHELERVTHKEDEIKMKINGLEEGNAIPLQGSHGFVSYSGLQSGLQTSNRDPARALQSTEPSTLSYPEAPQGTKPSTEDHLLNLMARAPLSSRPPTLSYPEAPPQGTRPPTLSHLEMPVNKVKREVLDEEDVPLTQHKRQRLV